MSSIKSSSSIISENNKDYKDISLIEPEQEIIKKSQDVFDDYTLKKSIELLQEEANF